MLALIATCQVALAVAPLRIAAVGDLMMYNMQPSRSLFASVRGTLRNADIAFANLEVPLTDVGSRTPFKSAADVAARRQYILKANPGWASYVADAGFDVVSFGNNHSMDFGLDGVRRMKDALRPLGVRYAGAGSTPANASLPAVVSKPGGTVAFLAYLGFRGERALRTCSAARYGHGGVNAIAGSFASMRSRLAHDIAGARARASLVVVSFHWGIERTPMPTPYQVQLGRMAVDLGADMVLGHHPHVLQPYEIYRGKPIFYSLGNFVSPVCGGANGETVIFRTEWSGRSLSSVRLFPVRIVHGSPKLLLGSARDAALRTLARSAAAFRRRFPVRSQRVSLHCTGGSGGVARPIKITLRQAQGDEFHTFRMRHPELVEGQHSERAIHNVPASTAAKGWKVSQRADIVALSLSKGYRASTSRADAEDVEAGIGQQAAARRPDG